MKKTRFTETQIVSTLKRQEAGIPTKEICRELGILEATFLPLHAYLFFRFARFSHFC